jgi:hypothetical protein
MFNKYFFDSIIVNKVFINRETFKITKNIKGVIYERKDEN